jgi:hypothetical protein
MKIRLTSVDKAFQKLHGIYHIDMVLVVVEQHRSW